MMCCSWVTFQIGLQKAKDVHEIKNPSKYILIMFCQYLIPPACYSWESTILCAGSQHFLTSTMHRFNTYSKYVTVRLLAVLIYMWMWRRFQENQPLKKNAKFECKVWPLAQAIYNTAGVIVYCLIPICPNYMTFLKLYVISEFSEDILILRIFPLKSCTVFMHLDCLLAAEFIYWGFCCCFLDNHSRFPQSSCFCVPWLRCTCCLWLILFVWTVLIFVGAILINFLFSQTVLIPVFYKGW